MMTVEMRPVAAITVADRVRDTVGDLHELKDSMHERGLINPVTIREDGTLIAGERRLTAARELGWTEIACHVWSDQSADELLAIEIEENTCRAPLTQVEAEKAWQRYREAYKSLVRPAHRPSGEEVCSTSTVNNAKASELAAKAVGYGRATLERVQEVRETAEDEAQPESVRQVAQQEYAKLSSVTNTRRRGEGVNPALERVRQAKRQATRDAMAPGQWLPSDEPQAPARVVNWHTRLWAVIGAGALPQDIDKELELDPDTSSLSDDDLSLMATRLQEQVRSRQDLRRVLLSMEKERKSSA